MKKLLCITLAIFMFATTASGAFATDIDDNNLISYTSESEPLEEVTDPGSGEDQGETEEPEINHHITNLKATPAGFGKVKLTWTKAPDYDGTYTIYRVVDGKDIRVGSTSKSYYTVYKLSPGKCYFRVKTNVMSSKVSATVIRTKTAKLVLIRSGLTNWDIRKAAKQKLYKYDTVQGACCYGGYAYVALYNRDVERVKIVKLRLSGYRVVKVSPPLPTHCHANTLTFNPKKNRIIATCGKWNDRKIVFISAKTLRQTSTRTFHLSSKFVGAPYTGLLGLSYNRKDGNYYSNMHKSGHFVRFSSTLKPSKHLLITEYERYLTHQGIFTQGDYVYDLHSFKGSRRYNIITIRTTSGKFIGKYKIPGYLAGKRTTPFELENMFYDSKNKTWYIMMYRSYIKHGKVYRKNYLYKLKNLW